MVASGLWPGVAAGPMNSATPAGRRKHDRQRTGHPQGCQRIAGGRSAAKTSGPNRPTTGAPWLRPLCGLHKNLRLPRNRVTPLLRYPVTPLRGYPRAGNLPHQSDLTVHHFLHYPSTLSQRGGLLAGNTAVPPQFGHLPGANFPGGRGRVLPVVPGTVLGPKNRPGRFPLRPGRSKPWQHPELHLP
jgi:hypothetical protein